MSLADAASSTDRVRRVTLGAAGCQVREDAVAWRDGAAQEGEARRLTGLDDNRTAGGE